MPRRSLLTAAQLGTLLSLPNSEVEIARHYTFDEFDISIIHQRRGIRNRFGLLFNCATYAIPAMR